LPEHDPFKLKRIMLWIIRFYRIFCGEPASTSPENALGRDGPEVDLSSFRKESHRKVGRREALDRVEANRPP